MQVNRWGDYGFACSYDGGWNGYCGIISDELVHHCRYFAVLDHMVEVAVARVFWAMKSNLFWGKAVIEGEEPLVLLPLSSHCLDVAAVFQALTKLKVIRARLEAAAGTKLSDEQLDRLAVVSLLHDLGKSNIGFQNKIFGRTAPKVGHIGPLTGLTNHFAAELAESLELQTLVNWFRSEVTLSGFLVAAWSHHGTPIKIDSADLTGLDNDKRWWHKDGERDPFNAIAELIAVSKKNFPSAFGNNVEKIPDRSTLQHRFCGLVMLADWLGSHRTYFPVERADSFDSFKAAKHIITAVGLDASRFREAISSATHDFSARFGLASPQALQEAIFGTAAKEIENKLLIAESETGSGKTEAAIWRFYDLLEAGEVDSLYFALPTRVAARELYSRIRAYIEKLIADPADRPPVVLAVPGYALVDGVRTETLLPDNTTRWNDDHNDRWREKAWAAERPKKFLASAIAVGTVDQALMSTLKVKHAHLRSVCLDRSLLVVDEVHASDVYMRQLLKCLLDHHVGLGGHALLLSATLGSAARAEFIAGLAKPQTPTFEEAISEPYPSITNRTGIVKEAGAPHSIARHKTVQVDVLPCMQTPEEILVGIEQALKEECRILVVLNTVARAIDLLRAAEASLSTRPDAFFSCNGQITPHHGRFAPKDRIKLDASISSRLGKGSQAGPLLLIGTQTLEQSLDIDADLLITDLCPMDVLLQRIGRLHRHDRRRPKNYERGQCIVLAPDEETLANLLSDTGMPVKAAKACGLGSVYEDMRCLQLTLSLLKSNSEINIPADNRRLVEGITHPSCLSKLSDTRMRMHGMSIEGQQIANKSLAARSSLVELYEQQFNQFRFREIEDERVRTRIGLNTLQLPLEKEVESPFGVIIDEIVIPEHMAPGEGGIEKVKITSVRDGEIAMQAGSKSYTYTRYGLEMSNVSE
jgi:CRISPR-associated endonuclease/helicase Cas3